MVGTSFPTTGGYGNGLINADGSALVDTEDGVPVVLPQFQPSNPAVPSGQFTPAQVDPDPNNTFVGLETGIPIFNALLVELRVHNALMVLQMGVIAPDLDQMRADESFVTSIVTGSV